jgi:hypothetical protein
MKLFITTSDGHDLLLKPFSYLFNKFWDSSKSVTVLGYRTPQFDLPKNFEFISMGKSRGDPLEWATDLRKYFLSIDDKHFVWGLEDHFLLRPVNLNLYNELKEIARSDESIGRIALTNDLESKPYNVTESKCESQLIELTQSSDYRVSFTWSMWNKEYLLKYLLPEVSAWDIERNEDPKNDGFRIVGNLNSHVIDFASGRRAPPRGGPHLPLDFKCVGKPDSYLDSESISELIDNKLILPNGKVHP